MRRPWTIVAGLMLCCGMLQAAMLCRATAPGLDAVRYAAAADSIDRDGPANGLRAQPEQPLFPLWAGLVHRCLKPALGDRADIWAISLQVAAAIPLVLVVVPLYFLTAKLYGSEAALWGTAFFCVLPEVASLGPRGLTDSTHLLFFALALWAVVAYFTGRRGQGNMAWLQEHTLGPCPRVGQSAVTSAALGHPAWLLAAGLATGLAILRGRNRCCCQSQRFL